MIRKITSILEKMTKINEKGITHKFSSGPDYSSFSGISPATQMMI